MNRRAFLKALSGGLAASVAVPFLPISAPPLPQGLAFHPDAFAMVMDDVRLNDVRARYLQPAINDLARRIDDDLTGISIRFIRDWDIERDKHVSKFDLFMVPPRLKN